MQATVFVLIDAFLLGPLRPGLSRLRSGYVASMRPGLLLWMLGRRARSPSVSFIGYWVHRNEYLQ